MVSSVKLVICLLVCFVWNRISFLYIAPAVLKFDIHVWLALNSRDLPASPSWVLELKTVPPYLAKPVVLDVPTCKCLGTVNTLPWSEFKFLLPFIYILFLLRIFLPWVVQCYIPTECVPALIPFVLFSVLPPLFHRQFYLYFHTPCSWFYYVSM